MTRIPSVTLRARRRLAIEALEPRLAPATLQGTAWQDLNANGIRDAGDPGLPGRTVFLDVNNNRVRDAGEAFTTTLSDGSYTFSNVPAGSYSVVEELPAGWVHTSPRSGPVTPATVASSAWQFQGPAGGDVVATAVNPTNPNVVMAALDSADFTSSNGGLYRSTDGGATWTEVWFFRGTEVQAIAYAAGGTLYASTFFGFYKSPDDGATWTQLSAPFLRSQRVNTVAPHPTDANTLLVGLNSTSSGGRARTVWKTTDGGATWTDLSPVGTTGKDVRAIAINPADPQQVAVGYGLTIAGTGLYVSTDGGATWANRSAGLSGGGISTVAFAGGALLVGGGNGSGLYRSPNLGQSWTSLTNTWPTLSARSVAVDPSDPQVIIVGTDADGVYRSINGGSSWTFAIGGTQNKTVNDVRFVGSKVLAGVGMYGVLASTNGGATFTLSNAGMNQFETSSVTVNPTNPAELAVTYTRGNAGGVLRSIDGGATWTEEAPGGTSFSFAKFAPDGRLYAAAGFGSPTTPEGLYRREANGTWTPIGPNFVNNQSDVNVLALAFSPTDPNVIVAVGQTVGGATDPNERQKATVWRTIDGGASWQKVYVQSADPNVTEVNDVEWLGTGNTLVATVADRSNQVPQSGGILRSTDGGANWTFSGSGQAGVPVRFQGAGVAEAPSNPDRVYVADGYPYLTSTMYVSTDRGATWAAGPPPSDVPLTLSDPVVDPADERIVYAVGGGGRVSRSVDGGITFAAFDQGLDDAGGQYGGLWSLTYVSAPTPHLVVASGSGVYTTELYATTPGARAATVAEPDTASGLDFGSRPLPGEVTGFVWEDEDANGVFLGEFQRPDHFVYLDINNNGRIDVGEPARRSLADGTVRFTGLPAGTYTTRLVVTPDVRQTFPANDGGHTTTIGPVQVSSGNDFGFQVIDGVLSGVKFNDLNDNGVRDPGEPGLMGWVMYLDLNADGVLDKNSEPWTRTDADGNYSFSIRNPGTYLLAEVPAPYWAQTKPGASSYPDPYVGFEPSPGTWADRDPSTPNVIDVWYDFRDYNGFTNEITQAQKDVVRLALDQWEQATGGRLKFTQNTTAPADQIITIGTGDLAAVGGTSAWLGQLGYGGSAGSGPGGLSSGVVWMDRGDTWDTTVGNGFTFPNLDYFTFSLREIGHAIGLGDVDALPFTWPGAVMNPDLSWTDELTTLSLVDVGEARRLYGDALGRGGFYVVRGDRAVTQDTLDFGATSTGTPPYADLFLDFGVTFTSTEPPGYSLVEFDTIDNPYTRYGWTAGTDRVGVHSGFNNPLLEDYVETSDSTFSAHVPNDTYDVTVTLGAPGRTFGPMRVSLEGTPVATVTAPSGGTVTATYRTTVTDGALDIRFDAPGGPPGKVGINAVTVVKALGSLSVSVNPNSFSEAAGANAATGTVTRTGDMTNALTVNLSSNDATEATVPPGVIIPAGQASATFPVTAVNDSLVDGTQSVTISASGPGFGSATTGVSVTDDDVAPTLTVTVNPSTFSEAAGSHAAQGTVTRSGSLSGNKVVTLSSSDTTEARVPATVTIPSGQASVTFWVSAVNDAIQDGPQPVTISAAASGLTAGSTVVTVTDNDGPLALGLTVTPAAFGEGAGPNAAIGRLTRNGELSVPLVVTLSSSDTTEAKVPAQITIPAGMASRTFWVGAVDDAVTDGPQTVRITATVGSVSRSTTVTVADNEPSIRTAGRFDFGTSSSAVGTGYTRVSAGAGFDPTVGYGWSAGTIHEVDRGAGWSDVDRDFNSTADGTFEVNVRNGTYAVTVTLGDATTVRDDMAVSLEGVRVANNVTARAGQFVRRTFLVRVTDGKLTLRLQDLGGMTPEAAINALEFNRVGN
jgi:hypothetical protein